MLYISSHIIIPDSEIDIHAMRSQGAGGQNVNKVSSAIHLQFDVAASSLPPFYKEELLKLNDHRISEEGVVTIKAQQYRSQEQNREDALARLSELIQQHQPDDVAIEDVFYAQNAKSALKLGQVRGVAMLAAAAAGRPVAEYAPLSIKSAVVGYGRAEKSQVQHMVARLLCLESLPQPSDAADALAIAICHLHTAATLARQAAAQT